MNSFKGSASGSIVALYRDSEASQVNVTAGLLEAIGTQQRRHDPEAADPTPEELAAYVYALLSTPAYQQRFADALEDKVVRVPLTEDPSTWAEAVALGTRLIWLHTFGERFQDAASTDNRLPRGDLSWTNPVSTLPKTRKAIRYDEDGQILHIGDGIVSGVRSDVWDYAVSGWPVVRRWLEHRTVRGRGRRGSELDDIRPSAWSDAWNDELLDLLSALTASCDLRSDQDGLLVRICDGPLIQADLLPKPTTAERAVPPTQRRSKQSQDQLSSDD